MGLLSRVREALQRREATPVAGPRDASQPVPSDGAPPGVAEIVGHLRAQVVAQSDGTRTPGDVSPGDHLYDCGHIDSMSAVSLLAFIEDEYDVSVEEADLVGRLGSLDALARHIAECRAAGGSG